jgi:hypothetical protein
VDDIAIIVRGHFLTTLRNLINSALNITQRWSKTKGRTVNPFKTYNRVFARKYKPEPTQPLKLGRKEIAFTCSVKNLGSY